MEMKKDNSFLRCRYTLASSARCNHLAKYLLGSSSAVGLNAYFAAAKAQKNPTNGPGLFASRCIADGPYFLFL
jgi:hypothetical protein